MLVRIICYVFIFEIGKSLGGVYDFLKLVQMGLCQRLYQDIICVLYGSVEEIIFLINLLNELFFNVYFLKEYLICYIFFI